MWAHVSNRTQSPFQASMHQKDCCGVVLRQGLLSTCWWKVFGNLAWWSIDLKRVAMSLWHVYWWRGATSGSSFHLEWKVFGHLVWWPIYLKRVAMLVCLLVWYWCAWGQAHIVKMLLSPHMFASLLLGRQLRYIAGPLWFQCKDSLSKSGIFYMLLKRFVRAGVKSFVSFIDWSALVGSFVCLLGFCFAVVCVAFSYCWPIIAIELSTNDYFSTVTWLPQLLWRSAALFKKKLRGIIAREFKLASISVLEWIFR